MLASRALPFALAGLLLITSSASAATLVFTTGSPAPGEPERSVDQISRPWFIGDEVGFTAVLDDGSRRFYLPDGAGSFTGTPVDLLHSAVSSPDGQTVVLNDSLAQPPRRLRPGPAELLLESNAPAPGTNARFRVADPWPPVSVEDWSPHPGASLVSNDGSMVIYGMLEGDGVDATNRGGFWRRSPGGELSLHLRAGDPVAGGGVLAGFSFELQRDGSGIGFTPDGDLVRFDTAGAASLALERGVDAPGAGGERFLAFNSTGGTEPDGLHLARDGDLLFTAWLGGDVITPDFGLWWLDAETNGLDIVLRAGDTLGDEGGIILDLLDVRLGESGHILLTTRESTGDAVWLRDPDGRWARVVAGLGARSLGVAPSGDVVAAACVRYDDCSTYVFRTDGSRELLAMTDVVWASDDGSRYAWREDIGGGRFGLFTRSIPEPTALWLLALAAGVGVASRLRTTS